MATAKAPLKVRLILRISLIAIYAVAVVLALAVGRLVVELCFLVSWP